MKVHSTSHPPPNTVRAGCYTKQNRTPRKLWKGIHKKPNGMRIKIVQRKKDGDNSLVCMKESWKEIFPTSSQILVDLCPSTYARCFFLGSPWVSIEFHRSRHSPHLLGLLGLLVGACYDLAGGRPCWLSGSLQSNSPSSLLPVCLGTHSSNATRAQKALLSLSVGEPPWALFKPKMKNSKNVLVKVKCAVCSTASAPQLGWEERVWERSWNKAVFVNKSLLPHGEWGRGGFLQKHSRLGHRPSKGRRGVKSPNQPHFLFSLYSHCKIYNWIWSTKGNHEYNIFTGPKGLCWIWLGEAKSVTFPSLLFLHSHLLEKTGFIF